MSLCTLCIFFITLLDICHSVFTGGIIKYILAAYLLLLLPLAQLFLYVFLSSESYTALGGKAIALVH